MRKQIYLIFLIAIAGVAALVALSVFLHRDLAEAHVRTIKIESVAALETFYDEIGYTLASVEEGDQVAPSIDLTAFPDDWRYLEASPERSDLFLRAMLPLALFANETIRDERVRLEAMQEVVNAGETLSASNSALLSELGQRYGLNSDTLAEQASDETLAALLLRVDAVPVSLVLAQAAIESGWGSSRFAHEGNALFGQWTFNGEGIVPEGGQRFGDNRIAAFHELLSSVAAYMLNLNSHNAYEGFRALRAKQRDQNESLDGYALAGELTAYSEKGAEYTRTLQQMMNQYDLTALREVKLDPDAPIYTLNP